MKDTEAPRALSRGIWQRMIREQKRPSLWPYPGEFSIPALSQDE